MGRGGLLAGLQKLVVHLDDGDGGIVGHRRGGDGGGGLYKVSTATIVYRAGHHGHGSQRIHRGVKTVCEGNVRNIKVLGREYGGEGGGGVGRGYTGHRGVVMLGIGIVLGGQKLMVRLLGVAGLDLLLRAGGTV